MRKILFTFFGIAIATTCIAYIFPSLITISVAIVGVGLFLSGIYDIIQSNHSY